MKKWMRWMSLLLVLVLVLGAFPAEVRAADRPETKKDVYTFTEKDTQALYRDVFAKIDDVTEQNAKKLGGVSKMTEQDFADLIPQVIEAVESSETYAEGTLRQNGSFLIWETENGIPCCYSPRMEAKKASAGKKMELPAKKAAAAPVPTKSGYPEGKEVALIQPYWDSAAAYQDSSFNDYSPMYLQAWRDLNEITGGTASYRYTLSDATVDNIAKALQECALVMIDSHGTTDYEGADEDYTSRANSSYICLTTSEGITSEDTELQEGTYGSYYNCLWGNGFAYVNGACVANHMTKKAPHNMLYMGICLGMATNKIFKPLRSKGVEAVYGYSQSVTFSGDTTYMKSIMGYLGEGNYLKNALSKTKKTYGKWDPAYSGYSLEGAVSAHAAFPIVVSSEDSYPGHGKVDAVQTVEATWRLYKKTSEPCTLRYHVNGVLLTEQSAKTWNEISLKKEAPAISGWSFLGWSLQEIPEATTSGPVYYQPGEKIEPKGDMDLYAVYSKAESCPTGYDLVTGPLHNWKGTYVITYSDTSEDMLLMRGLSGDWTSYEDLSSNGGVTAADAGVTIKGHRMTDVKNKFRFYVTEGDSGYYIQNKVTETYLSNSGNLITRTEKDPDISQWNFRLEDVGAVIDSGRLDFPVIALDYNNCFSAQRDTFGIYLWKYNNGKQINYSTIPKPWDGSSLSKPVITLSNDPATGKIKVSWKLVPGATSYKVYRATSNTGSFKLMKTTTNVTYTNSSAVAGKTYYYRVRAVNDEMKSKCSLTKYRTCDLPRPVVKKSHVASTGKNKLTWTAIDGAVKYQVYRSESKDGTYNLAKTTKDTSYINVSGEAGVTYYYKVTALAEKEAANSAAALVSLTCDLPRPVISGTHEFSTGKNKLTWKKISGAVSYKVYRATKKDGPYKLMKTTTDTSYVNTSAVAGKTYYYRVKAVASNTAANSAYSRVKCLTCDLPRPVVKTGFNSAGKPKLTWKEVPGAVKYQVYRAAKKDGPYKLMKTTVDASYVNTSAVKGKTYYYKVRAIAENSAANSAYSLVKTVTSK